MDGSPGVQSDGLRQVVGRSPQESYQIGHVWTTPGGGAKAEALMGVPDAAGQPTGVGASLESVYFRDAMDRGYRVRQDWVDESTSKWVIESPGVTQTITNIDDIVVNRSLRFQKEDGRSGIIGSVKKVVGVRPTGYDKDTAYALADGKTPDDKTDRMVSEIATEIAQGKVADRRERGSTPDRIRTRTRTRGYGRGF